MRHPIHPMIVHFPIVGWIMTFAGDIYQYFVGTDNYAHIIQIVAISSCVMAILTMAAGLIDYLRQQPKEAIAQHIETHMYWALALFLVFTFRALLPSMLSDNLLFWSLLCSGLGFVLIIYVAKLGADLVYVHGVGQINNVNNKADD